MTHSHDDDGDDERGGKRRPPRGRPFESGRSGNSRGRPRKASASFPELLQTAFHKKRVREQAGKKVSFSAAQLTVDALVRSAAKGDLKIAQFIAKQESVPTRDGKTAPPEQNLDPDSPLTEAELAAFGIVADRLRRDILREYGDDR